MSPPGNLETLEEWTDTELVRRAGLRGEGARAVETELSGDSRRGCGSMASATCATTTARANIVQAVLLVLVEAVRAARIAEPEHVDRFVLGTCRNVVARMREGDGRAIAVDPVDLEIIGAMPTFERLDTPALLRCLVKLNLRSRMVMQMCFHDEVSAAEIGARLGMTAVGVRVLRHRAIAQLRQCLDKGQEADA